MRSVVPLCLCLALVVGCSSGSSGDDGPGGARPADAQGDDEQVGGVDAETVDVPVRQSDRDQGFVVEPSGTLSNQQYRQGAAGSVIVQARPTGATSAEAAPTVSGVLVLSDGTRVRCEPYDASAWGSRHFGPLDLRCESLVDLDLAEELVIDGG